MYRYIPKILTRDLQFNTMIDVCYVLYFNITEIFLN